MAEIGIVASIVQIADIGLRLSLRLYTFGEVVSAADKSVISISKDVSLTSSVLKELGRVLEKDQQSRICSDNAVQTADGIVKECLSVFEEMEKVLVKKLPHLGPRDGEWTKRATMLLERLKWPYLQPKLELMRSNLERLKSTLNLMLNVITLAKHQIGRSESPEVIAQQKTLIEDLAKSNDDYVRKFEQMRLSADTSPMTQPVKQDGSMPISRSISGLFSNGTNIDRSTTNLMYTSSPRNGEVPGNNGTDFLPLLLWHYNCLREKLVREVDVFQYHIPYESRCRIRHDLFAIHKREAEQARLKHKATNDQRLQCQQQGSDIIPSAPTLSSNTLYSQSYRRPARARRYQQQTMEAPVMLQGNRMPSKDQERDLQHHLPTARLPQPAAAWQRIPEPLQDPKKLQEAGQYHQLQQMLQQQNQRAQQQQSMIQQAQQMQRTQPCRHQGTVPQRPQSHLGPLPMPYEISDREKKNTAALENNFGQLENDEHHQAQKIKTRTSNFSDIYTPSSSTSEQLGQATSSYSQPNTSGLPSKPDSAPYQYPPFVVDLAEDDLASTAEPIALWSDSKDSICSNDHPPYLDHYQSPDIPMHFDASPPKVARGQKRSRSPEAGENDVRSGGRQGDSYTWCSSSLREQSSGNMVVPAHREPSQLDANDQPSYELHNQSPANARLLYNQLGRTGPEPHGTKPQVGLPEKKSVVDELLALWTLPAIPGFQ